ncbi:MAG: aa3-type cytochrome c oxidase subunit IV [Pseudomonadota bacterium]
MAEKSDKKSVGAEKNVMDYPEHERTYDFFVVGAKWLTIFCCALLLAMAFGFFAGGGLFGGTVVLIGLMVIAYFLA